MGSLTSNIRSLSEQEFVRYYCVSHFNSGFSLNVTFGIFFKSNLDKKEQYLFILNISEFISFFNFAFSCFFKKLC